MLAEAVVTCGVLAVQSRVPALRITRVTFSGLEPSYKRCQKLFATFISALAACACPCGGVCMPGMHGKRKQRFVRWPRQQCAWCLRGSVHQRRGRAHGRAAAANLDTHQLGRPRLQVALATGGLGLDQLGLFRRQLAAAVNVRHGCAAGRRLALSTRHQPACDGVR